MPIGPGPIINTMSSSDILVFSRAAWQQHAKGSVNAASNVDTFSGRMCILSSLERTYSAKLPFTRVPIPFLFPHKL